MSDLWLRRSSGICAGLDEHVEAVRTRPLGPAITTRTRTGDLLGAIQATKCLTMPYLQGFHARSAVQRHLDLCAICGLLLGVPSREAADVMKLPPTLSPWRSVATGPHRSAVQEGAAVSARAWRRIARAGGRTR
jgi:hypothetical protein